MTLRSLIHFNAVLLAFTLPPRLAGAATITLTPAADTSVMEIAPFNNMGSVQSLAIGVTATESASRGLIKFDLSAIPPNSVINSAALTIVVVREGTLVEDSTFDLHRILVPWGEGNKGAGLITGSGSGATDGEATWVARLHPITFWGSGGGAAGSDYVATPSASTGTSSQMQFGSTADTVADVQAWLSNPNSNYGWLVKDQFEGSAQTARRVGSRENAEAPPRLLVDYTVAAVLQITDVAIDAGKLCFQFQASAGKSYRIERRALVDSGEWIPVENTPIITTAGPVSVCDTIGTGTAFYRVAEL